MEYSRVVWLKLDRGTVPRHRMVIPVLRQGKGRKKGKGEGKRKERRTGVAAAVTLHRCILSTVALFLPGMQHGWAFPGRQGKARQESG